jgi:hypothetical protein
VIDHLLCGFGLTFSTTEIVDRRSRQFIADGWQFIDAAWRCPKVVSLRSIAGRAQGSPLIEAFPSSQHQLIQR